MRLRSVATILSLSAYLLWTPGASGQQRIFARVAPNVTALNDSADLYDPQNGTISPVPGRMIYPRQDHIAVLLRGGKVLIAGGYNDHYLNAAEIFDPATGRFSVNMATRLDPTTGQYKTEPGTLTTPRSSLPAVVLRSGRVLFAGGFNGNYLQTAEIYDPATGAFNSTSSAML